MPVASSTYAQVRAAGLEIPAILVTGHNFGAGSSREAAVWGMLANNIRVIVARSFADIYRENCLQNGLLPIVLAPDEAYLLHRGLATLDLRVGRACATAAALRQWLVDLAEDLSSLDVEEQRDGQVRRRDVRPMILSLAVVSPQALRLEARMDGEGSIRPELLLTLMGVPTPGIRITRERIVLAP